MEKRSTRLRLRTLLAWSSPVLILVLLAGVGSVARPAPPTAASSSAVSFSNGSGANGVSGPLGSALRGELSGATSDVVLPLGTTRPWYLSRSSSTTATLWCGAQAQRVPANVVVATTPSCQLELHTTAPQAQPWTLTLVP